MRLRARGAGPCGAASAETSILFSSIPFSSQTALAGVGLPIAGDVRYGAPPAGGAGVLALHAATLSLVHPAIGREPLRLRAPVPPEWRRTFGRALLRAVDVALAEPADGERAGALWQPPPMPPPEPD